MDGLYLPSWIARPSYGSGQSCQCIQCIWWSAAWRRRRRVHFQSCFWLLEEQWLRKRSLLSRASLMMVCQASSNPLDSGRAFVTILNPGKLSFKENLREIEYWCYRKSFAIISQWLELNKAVAQKQNWNFLDVIFVHEFFSVRAVEKKILFVWNSYFFCLQIGNHDKYSLKKFEDSGFEIGETILLIRYSFFVFFHEEIRPFAYI